MTRKGKLEREGSTVIVMSTDSLYPEEKGERKSQKYRVSPEKCIHTWIAGCSRFYLIYKME